MHSLTRAGVVFRTKLMTQPQATAFQRCLSSNPRFKEPIVLTSERAKDPEKKYFVSFKPVNPESLDKIAETSNDDRRGRGYAEGEFYNWVFAEGDEGPFWRLLSYSGGMYRVGLKGESCDCPDYTERCRHTGILCKHLHAFHAGLGKWYAPEEDGSGQEREEEVNENVGV